MRHARISGLPGLAAACLTAIIALTGLALSGPAAHAQERTLRIDDTSRQYILHMPRNAPAGPMPLVIALHGALQPASILQRYLDLDAIADREGFIVAYPKGINLIWNDGRKSVAGFIPILNARDDAGFVLAVRDALIAEGLVDPGRTYLMGFSNGGFLTAFVACRYADRFAAFATMMMTVPVGYEESCKPDRPVPILMMNGTYDPIVPMFGRPTPGARLMSASEGAELFARINQCEPPQTTSAPNTRILRWSQCAGGSQVAFYEIAGGHQPPAQSTDVGDAFAALLLGPRRSGIDAPQEIWSFFKQYGTPAVPVLAAPPLPGEPLPSLPAPPAAGVADPLPLRPASGTSGAAPHAATMMASAPLPPASPLRRRSASAE